MPLTKHGYGGYHGGLPVLVVGVVIGGLAPEIGSWPLPVVAITLAALGATMVVVVSALRSVRMR